MDRMPAWAEALGLESGTGPYRRFMRLAAIAHMPKESQPEFVALLDELDHLRTRVERIESEG